MSSPSNSTQGDRGRRAVHQGLEGFSGELHRACTDAFDVAVRHRRRDCGRPACWLCRPPSRTRYGHQGVIETTAPKIATKAGASHDAFRSSVLKWSRFRRHDSRQDQLDDPPRAPPSTCLPDHPTREAERVPVSVARPAASPPHSRHRRLMAPTPGSIREAGALTGTELGVDFHRWVDGGVSCFVDDPSQHRQPWPRRRPHRPACPAPQRTVLDSPRRRHRWPRQA